MKWRTQTIYGTLLLPVNEKGNNPIIYVIMSHFVQQQLMVDNVKCLTYV